MKCSTHIDWLVLWSTLFVGTGCEGFQQKTTCLVDYILSEDELEGEGPNLYQWGEHQPSLPTLDVRYGNANGVGLGYGHLVDHEDMMERMGYGEMDEMEGMMAEGYRPRSYSRPNNLEGIQGYMDADGEWEDLKRRKRRRRRKRQVVHHQHSPAFLYGDVRCDTDARIHVNNVTLGYSSSPYCRQAMPGCEATSHKAKQVLHCQGKTHTCKVSILRHFLKRCGQRVNFAQITYECVPASHLVDICANQNSDETDAVVITSASYPDLLSARTDSLLTCECTLRSASPSVFEIAYLRANLPGKPGSCHGDLLLIEYPMKDQRDRYQIESEICGANYTRGVRVINDNILRVTFLGGAPASSAEPGFSGKFQAKTPDGEPDLFHVSCQSSLPSADPELKTTPTAAATASASVSNEQNAYANHLREWLAKTGRKVPTNFDPSSLPANFFNMSREELKAKMRSNGRTDQSGAHTQMSAAILGSILDSMAEGKFNAENKTADESGNPGVLSAVIAALASIIVIMGSLSGLYFYSRWQRRRRYDDDRNEQYVYADGSTSNFPDPKSQKRRNTSETMARTSSPNIPSTTIYSVASSVPFSPRTADFEEASRHVAEVHEPSRELSVDKTPLPPARRKKGATTCNHSDDTSNCTDYDISNAIYDNACYSNPTTVVTAPPRRKRKSQKDVQEDQQRYDITKSDENYSSIDEVMADILSHSRCDDIAEGVTEK